MCEEAMARIGVRTMHAHNSKRHGGREGGDEPCAGMCCLRISVAAPVGVSECSSAPASAATGQGLSWQTVVRL